MGSELAEAESTIPKLPLFFMHSPERSRVLTPPLQTSLPSPIPMTCYPSAWNSLLGCSFPLPPLSCRVLMSPPTSFAPLPLESPTIAMVLTEGCLGPWFSSKEEEEEGTMGGLVLGGKTSLGLKEEVTGGSHVFPSDKDTNVADTHKPKIKRSGSDSSSTLFHAKSRVWASICEGLKPVVPWKSIKLKKDGSGLSL